MGGFTKAEGLFLYVLILIHIGVAIYALWMTNFLFFIFYLLSGGIFWALYRKKMCKYCTNKCPFNKNFW